MPNLLLKSPHILLVDDEPRNLEQLMALLEPRQAVLFKARSGEQALKILSKTPIDVVVSDWQMPGLSGLELIGHLRATGFKGPLLIFTGTMLDAEHLQQALDAGASDYLRKPLNIVEFNARLDKSLQLYAQQYALETFNDSQNKLMALMTNRLGSEIQRLAQVQALEGLKPQATAYEQMRYDSTERLKVQFQELMAWSRYRFALKQIEAHRFEIRPLFKSIENKFSAQAMRLRLKGGTGMQALSHLDLLQRVLLQLVDNALRYTPGEVTLKCSDQGSYLRLEVLDEGLLSEGELERLTSDQISGLGLRICHDLLALLGSRLQAQRRLPKGSRFYFDIPVA